MDAQTRYAPGPCANCGKPHGGTMYSSSWCHGYHCCSDRCGKRLEKRISNGMFTPKVAGLFDPFLSPSSDDPRIQSMRTRISQLKHQLRIHGIKPHSDRWKLDEDGEL